MGAFGKCQEGSRRISKVQQAIARETSAAMPSPMSLGVDNIRDVCVKCRTFPRNFAE